MSGRTVIVLGDTGGGVVEALRGALAGTDITLVVEPEPPAVLVTGSIGFFDAVRILESRSIQPIEIPIALTEYEPRQNDVAQLRREMRARERSRRKTLPKGRR